MKGFVRRSLAVPIRAYPRVISHRLHRGWAAFTASEMPSHLTDDDLLTAFGASSIRQLVTEFRARGSPRFFLGNDPVERASVVAAACPGLEGRIRMQAEEIMAHQIYLLGSGFTNLGIKIPWRKDFNSGHEWPLEHYSRLTIVDLDAGFDIKVPWELSRFHHAPTLGQCYLLTGEEKYAQEFVAQLTDWWEENPHEFGPNWANAMEAAVRSANWICGYELLCKSPALDDSFMAAFLKSMLQHGRYIARHLETGWPGSNHLIAGLCGLVGLGVFMSPTRESNLWRIRALSMLRRTLKSQVLADGADYEGSSSYHLLVAEMLLWTVQYCDRNNVTVTNIIRERLSDMLDVVYGLLRPDGNIPLFGDCDSGRWLVLESDRRILPSMQDARGVLALAAVLFDRPDWAAPSGPLPPPMGEGLGGGCRWEAALWAFGSRASELYERQSSSDAKRSQALVSFPDAGWYVMRHGDNYMAITAGGNGTEGWGGHSHNDALSFELAIGERTFLIDPGSYTYTGDFHARNAFRCTAAHNTLRVGRQEINRIPERDMFRLENEAWVRKCEWKEDHERIWITAKCVCSRGMRKRYSHQRRFEYNRELNYWLISDEVDVHQSASAGQCEIFFHFAPVPLVMEGLNVQTVCSNGPNLALIPLEDVNASLTVSLERGWISHRYGERTQAPIVRYCGEDADIRAAQFAIVPFSRDADLDSAQRVLQHLR